MAQAVLHLGRQAGSHLVPPVWVGGSVHDCFEESSVHDCFEGSSVHDCFEGSSVHASEQKLRVSRLRLTSRGRRAAALPCPCLAHGCTIVLRGCARVRSTCAEASCALCQRAGEQLPCLASGCKCASGGALAGVRRLQLVQACPSTVQTGTGLARARCALRACKAACRPPLFFRLLNQGLRRHAEGGVAARWTALGQPRVQNSRLAPTQASLCTPSGALPGRT